MMTYDLKKKGFVNGKFRRMSDESAMEELRGMGESVYSDPAEEDENDQQQDPSKKKQGDKNRSTDAEYWAKFLTPDQLKELPSSPAQRAQYILRKIGHLRSLAFNSKLNSDLERKFLYQYWFGKGHLQLTQDEFAAIASYVEGLIVNTNAKGVSKFKDSKGNEYISMTVNLYGSPN